MNNQLFKFKISKWEAQSRISITWNGIKSTKLCLVSPCNIELYSSTNSSNLGCANSIYILQKGLTWRWLTSVKKIQKDEKKKKKKLERKALIQRAEWERKETMRGRDAATLTWPNTFSLAFHPRFLQIFSHFLPVYHCFWSL